MDKELVKLERSILSDIEILDRIIRTDESCIFVSPIIDPVQQLSPASLDLRLGTDLFVTKNIASTHIDLTSRKEIVKQKLQYYDHQRVLTDGYFVLHPGEFALASTLEFIRLPKDIAGRLEGRSSLGRVGLQVHATAGFVDPGFEGSLTYELINAGKLPVKLRPGIRLGQMCFITVNEVQVGYMDKKNSKYGGKLGVELTRFEEDPEVDE